MSGHDVSDQVRGLVEPLLAPGGLELVDVELAAGVLRVTVDRPGGVDLDAVSQASRLISDLLDQHEPELPSLAGGRYVLEVSSPGIERSLRTPEHFRRFVGSHVVLKTVPGTDGDRRLEGTLEAAGDEGVVVSGRAVAYAEIERARTRFVWPVASEPKRKAGSRR